MEISGTPRIPTKALFSFRRRANARLPYRIRNPCYGSCVPYMAKCDLQGHPIRGCVEHGRAFRVRRPDRRVAATLPERMLGHKKCADTSRRKGKLETLSQHDGGDNTHTSLWAPVFLGFWSKSRLPITLHSALAHGAATDGVRRLLCEISPVPTLIDAKHISP